MPNSISGATVAVLTLYNNYLYCYRHQLVWLYFYKTVQVVVNPNPTIIVSASPATVCGAVGCLLLGGTSYVEYRTNV